MRSKGKIAVWNDEKGYGFLEQDDTGPRVFVHIKAFAKRNRRPKVGDIVTCAVTKDGKGRARAESASFVGGMQFGLASLKRGTLTIVIAILFLAGLTAWATATSLPLVVPAAYVFVSLVTFVAYAIDKSAARRGRWRTKEGTLHVLALVGGWPGAMVARQTLRHKSRKASFRVVFWATVLLNCAALIWLHTADGRSSLDQVTSAILLLVNSATQL